MVKKDSIVAISIKTQIDDLQWSEVHTIGIVCKTTKKRAYIDHAITSIDGKEYKNTKSIMKDYGYENLNDVKLCTPQEFDIVVDTGIIPRNLIKNVK